MNSLDTNMEDYNTLTLDTERLRLAPISFIHCNETYLKWMNDPETIRYLETGGSYTMEELRNYIENAVNNKIYFWGIHLKSNGKHIGNIKIDPINYKHGYGEYGILMGDRDEWGKGYAKEASSVVIEFCFNVLKLRKINLGVAADNKNAVSLYEKIGFIVEGILKEHGFYGGKLCNVLRMAIFNKGNL